LHFIPDEDDPGAIVATLMSALAPGSHLVSSHVTAELDPEGIHGMERAYRAGGLWAGARSAADFGRLFFNGLELVDPGVVLITDWRPADGEPRPLASEVSSNGAVARKPST
jgi:S-adenosyl methyltransferase